MKNSKNNNKLKKCQLSKIPMIVESSDMMSHKGRNYGNSRIDKYDNVIFIHE